MNNDTNSGSLEIAQAKLSGFTLIELLVTLVIVSVLAAATLPAFKNVIVERKTSVAALEVKAFLDAARARAIARGRPVSVILERLSSRGDGLGIDGTAVISPTNPPRSITAENPPAPLTLPWTPSDVATNFDVYNTCIRMVMAESMRPVEIEFSDPFNLAVNGFRATDEGTALDDLPNSGALSDALDEPHKLILIPGALDNRLPSLLVPGNDIDIESTGGAVYSSTILAVTPVAGNYLIKIRNEGLSTNPYGSPLDVAQLADDQLTMHSYVNMGIAKTLRIYSQPRPVASMVTELPRGSCIDLSLSGLASDDPNVNPTNNVFRDCRRQFASDWILPPLVLPPPVPIPQSLRPVYLNFSASGKLQSVLCNGPSSASLRRIEPQSDVCLFVGRNDQVIRAASTADLAAAEDASLKPNLMDPTSYWVRISPSSGAISAAPAQASHIIEDVADFRAGNPAEPIGHLLEDSRSLIFGAELTSQ